MIVSMALSRQNRGTSIHDVWAGLDPEMVNAIGKEAWLAVNRSGSGV